MIKSARSHTLKVLSLLAPEGLDFFGESPSFKRTGYLISRIYAWHTTHKTFTVIIAVSGLNRMSGIEATPGSQELTTLPRKAARYRLQLIPIELTIKVLKYLPDLSALSRLFTAYPETFVRFEKYRNEIVSSIVKNMSPELRNSALDVLVIRSRSPVPPSRMTRFIKNHLDARTSYTRFRVDTYSLSALLDLIEISGSIESLSESFARDRVLRPSKQHSKELSLVELHRIRRSLWRFQLCYEMCHQENLRLTRKIYDVESRSTRKYVHYQTEQPINRSIPNWLQCRGETFRPEALSSFLPNLSRWEHDELEAVRFHLAQEVNKLQYLWSCEPADNLLSQPVLLQRLIRDIDHWDMKSPKDHVLVASFRQTRYTKCYPIVWERPRDLFDASSPNTPRRFAIQALQEGHPQWGWCLWDEERLLKRGLIDIEYEEMCKRWERGDGSLAPTVYERRAVIGWAHEECVRSQYSPLDRRIAAQYEMDARIHAERIRWDTVWELGREGREWMPTEMDRVYEG